MKPNESAFKDGDSVTFAARDSTGVLRAGRGRLVKIMHNGTLLVRLAKNWWGTYLKGKEILVSPWEVTQEKSK